jgi:hypothetical protein
VSPAHFRATRSAPGNRSEQYEHCVTAPERAKVVPVIAAPAAGALHRPRLAVLVIEVAFLYAAPTPVMEVNRGADVMGHIEMLPAERGDCIWIEYGNRHRPHGVLIDGGPLVSFGHLRDRIEALPSDQRRFELFVDPIFGQ